MEDQNVDQIDDLEIEALSDDELDSVAGGVAELAVTDASSCSCSCCVSGATRHDN